MAAGSSTKVRSIIFKLRMLAHNHTSYSGNSCRADPLLEFDGNRVPPLLLHYSHTQTIEEVLVTTAEPCRNANDDVQHLGSL